MWNGSAGGWPAVMPPVERPATWRSAAGFVAALPPDNRRKSGGNENRF